MAFMYPDAPRGTTEAGEQSAQEQSLDVKCNIEVVRCHQGPGFLQAGKRCFQLQTGKGLVDMAAQAGKLLDYSAHAWESFTAITLAYVLMNAFIMLVMMLVERKVRLPGNMGGK